MTNSALSRDQFTESAALSVETITYVHHWCEGLFTLKMTRPASFRFRSGEFVMIGGMATVAFANAGLPLPLAAGVVPKQFNNHMYHRISSTSSLLTLSSSHIDWFWLGCRNNATAFACHCHFGGGIEFEVRGRAADLVPILFG